MDKVAFPYRSSSHLILMHVVAESGAWEKHGLQVDYDRHISSTEAHRAVPAGNVEFVGGNHVSTYGHRARGDSWVYLGQTVNQVNYQLVVRPNSDINGLADLHGRLDRDARLRVPSMPQDSGRPGLRQADMAPLVK